MQADVTQTTVNAETVSADFFTRLVAYIIDAVIIGIPLGIVMMFLPVMLGYILGLAASVGYVLYFWTTTGQTIGKKVMGLKVVSAETGNILTMQEAGLRYVGYIVSSIPLSLGFFWIIWDPNHDGWHDKIAKTKVIKV